MNDRIWFNTTQASEHAGRHPDTVRDALEAQRLHGSQPKTRGHWRIHRDCLDAWLLGTPCPHAARTAKSA